MKVTSQKSLTPKGAVEPSKEPLQFAFYLVPGFTMTALASALEGLRLANLVLGYEAYTWRLVSQHGDAVVANSGQSLLTDACLASERKNLFGAQRPFMAIVHANEGVEQYVNLALEAWLRECRYRGIAVGGIGTATEILARAGLLTQRRCAVHWEKLPSFAERFNDTIPESKIFAMDDGIWTCAGGAAAFDMILHIVDQQFGAAAVASISAHALVERVRSSDERQRLPLISRHGPLNRAVISVVEHMELHLAEPIPIDVLAARVHLSRRQVERLFRGQLNLSPVSFYRKLRLEKASLLLTQSTMPVVEIAVACGFISASHFSKCFREVHGVSPLEARRTKYRPAIPEIYHRGPDGVANQALDTAA